MLQMYIFRTKKMKRKKKLEYTFECINGKAKVHLSARVNHQIGESALLYLR